MTMKKFFVAMTQTGCVLLLVGLAACGGGGSQISGISKQLSFKTRTCVLQQQTLKIRNENTEEPQRVQGLFFEPGTNNFDKQGKKPEVLVQGETYVEYFKIDEVLVSGKPQKTLGNRGDEVILPPGGVLEIKVSYMPRAATAEELHYAYLDVLLNGPKTGVMQFELQGEAGPDDEACAALGQVRQFKVKQVALRIVDDDLVEQGGEIIPDPITDVSNLFQFTVDADGNAIMTKADFPAFSIPAPGFKDGVAAGLYVDATGTFKNGGELEFADMTLSAASTIDIPDAQMTTGSTSVQNTDGSIEDSGSPLVNGEMTVLIVAPLNNALFKELDGGVISAKIELEEI